MLMKSLDANTAATTDLLKYLKSKEVGVEPPIRKFSAHPESHPESAGTLTIAPGSSASNSLADDASPSNYAKESNMANVAKPLISQVGVMDLKAFGIDVELLNSCLNEAASSVTLAETELNVLVEGNDSNDSKEEAVAINTAVQRFNSTEFEIATLLSQGMSGD